MAWSVSANTQENPELVNIVLSAVGKSLYVANMFESKCKSFLGLSNLIAGVADNPALASSIEDLFPAFQSNKMLGATLRDLEIFELNRYHISVEAKYVILNKAKDARNYIAHEGAYFGHAWAATTEILTEHMAKLRSAVSELSNGDDIISNWFHQIEWLLYKNRTDPDEEIWFHFVDKYPQLVDEWIFGEFDLWATQ
jgi:hypothetical protein